MTMYLGTTLANVVVLLFLVHHVSAITTEMAGLKSGLCKSLCEKRRPTGIVSSFKFNCDTEECKESCENCPKEVCDETLDGDEANNWHCPKVVLGSDCMAVCNKYREKGMRENYTVNCEEDFSDDKTKLKKCKNDCTKCPSFICTDGTLSCPYEPFTGKCREFCDEQRAYGEVDPFSFLCASFATDKVKETECKDICKSDDCPDWVCDGRSRDIAEMYKFHCPSYQAHPDCRNFCDSKRNGDGPYNLKCRDALPQDPNPDPTKCEKKCNDKKCNENSIAVCDTALSTSPQFETFKCPRREPPEDEALEEKKSYKGRCTEFCEKNRGGGIDPFELSCSGRYKTPAERLKCETVCKTNCADKGKQIGECYIYGENHVIKCDGQRRKIREREEDERRKEQRWADRLENDKDSHFDFVVGSIVFTLVTIVCFCVALIHMRRKNFVPPLISQQPVVAVAAQQSQPQMQVSAVSQPSSQMLQPQPPQDGN